MKLVTIFLLFYGSALYATGPQTIAFSERSTWPEAIDSPSSFDRASRAEILVFADILNTLAAQNAEALKSQLAIKQVNLLSVQQVRDKLIKRLLENWRNAAAACKTAELFCKEIQTPEALLAAGKSLSSELPESYRAWYDNTHTFHKNYANELIRLAALFPAISSEIDTFSKLEHQGFELPDRQFLLTFDDGPTNQKGYTDTLLPLLKQAGIHATFYMLGERLEARLKQDSGTALKKAFEGQCVAMHGWQHQSHAKWETWQKSITDTRDLLKTTFAEAYRPWFRPPYGQRKADSGEFFKKNNLQVALWNIDSQDWNAKISGDAAAQRVFTLMLLWRRGVILFHDVHPKALVAVPWLMAHSQNTGVAWQDCRSY